MWEGIDIASDVLSLLVVVKLPFAVPDAISEFEQAQYASTAEYKREVVIPEMLVKLKQGVGRLIRRESDTGVIAILDLRVNKSAYRKSVFDALPKCRRTSDIGEVERFIRDKKDEG